MSDEHRQAQPPEQAAVAEQPNHDARPAAVPSPPQTPAVPQMPAAERVRLAARQRGESDYIFSYWTALGWTILTLGIYGFYVFYQLMRRMRDLVVWGAGEAESCLILDESSSARVTREPAWQ